MERGCPEGMEPTRTQRGRSCSDKTGLIRNSWKWIETLQDKQPQAGSEHCSPAEETGSSSPLSQHRSTFAFSVTELAAEATPARKIKARSSTIGTAIFDRICNMWLILSAGRLRCQSHNQALETDD